MTDSELTGAAGADHRSVIIARIRPGTQSQVARVFAESDATALPRDLGVTHRSLWALQDLYVHMVDFDRPVAESMALAVNHPAFRQISSQLSAFISPYDPQTWRSPRDAAARRFYSWRP